jgi:hypothetical protein
VKIPDRTDHFSGHWMLCVVRKEAMVHNPPLRDYFMHSARRGTVAVLLLLFASPLISQTTKAPDAVVVRAAKMLNVKAGKVVANPVVIIEG